MVIFMPSPPELVKIKYRLNGFDLRKLLNNKVEGKIHEKGYFPVSIALIKEETKKEETKPEQKDKDTKTPKIKISFMTISYETSNDAKNKIASIEGEDPELLKTLIEELERLVE